MPSRLPEAMRAAQKIGRIDLGEDAVCYQCRVIIPAWLAAL